MFTYRLFQYLHDPLRKQIGFIPDVINILYKYDLQQYLFNYVFSGTFPPKFSWKTTVKTNINATELDKKLFRIHSNSDFERFRQLIELGKPSSVWTYGLTSAACLQTAKKISKLWTLPIVSGNCRLSYLYSNDILRHQILNCSALFYYRQIMKDKLYSTLGHDNYAELVKLENNTLCNVLLGTSWVHANPDTILTASGPFLTNCFL